MSDDLTPPHWGADEPARYDMSIHSNPSAAAWAAFFKQTFPDSDEDLMHGWFANAMMAMHDHMQPATIPYPAMQLPEVRVLAEAAEYFAKNRKSIMADIGSAHSGRGAGASSWMREDDNDFYHSLGKAFDDLSVALAQLKETNP